MKAHGKHNEKIGRVHDAAKARSARWVNARHKISNIMKRRP